MTGCHGWLRIAAASFAVALLLASCSTDRPVDDLGGQVDAETPARPEPGVALDLATELGVRNARMPIEGVVTAGQPTPEQLDALVEAGTVRFISLRPASEEGAGWEEAHDTGGPFAFDRLAIAGEGDLTRENVEAFAALLGESGDETTVVYCASSNRVGAMFALKAYWLDGASAEDALELGRAAGMTRLENAVAEQLGLRSPE